MTMVSEDKVSYKMDTSGKREFYRELFSLAIPIGLQSLLTALIGASDALMLGRLTQDAVAAVSLANQIAFIMNLFIGAGIGYMRLQRNFFRRRHYGWKAVRSESV